MVTMTTLSAGAPYTRADLDALPDDGRRHELIDGVLVVTPSPAAEHQQVLRGLVRAMLAACPTDFEFLFAPFEVILADDTVLQPDLLVTRPGDVSRRGLVVPPLLAVEVLSPSTRQIDLTLKRSRYEAAGTAGYWVIDPVQLSLRAWQLVDGAYAEVGYAVGDQPFHSTSPFPITIVPAELGR